MITADQSLLITDENRAQMCASLCACAFVVCPVELLLSLAAPCCSFKAELLSMAAAWLVSLISGMGQFVCPGFTLTNYRIDADNRDLVGHCCARVRGVFAEVIELTDLLSLCGTGSARFLVLCSAAFFFSIGFSRVIC